MCVFLRLHLGFSGGEGQQFDLEWEGKILSHLRGPTYCACPSQVDPSHVAGKEEPSSQPDELCTLGSRRLSGQI